MDYVAEAERSQGRRGRAKRGVISGRVLSRQFTLRTLTIPGARLERASVARGCRSTARGRSFVAFGSCRFTTRVGFRRRTYQLLNPEPDDRLGNCVTRFILALIGLNVAMSVAETEPDWAAAAPDFFYYGELFSTLVFTVEYVARIWSCVEDPRYQRAFSGRLRQAKTPLALIDLVAILPFYLQLLLPGNVDLRFVRALRLFRLFRIFKIGRASDAFDTLLAVFAQKRHELLVSVFVVLVSIVFAASAMYLCENEAQPDRFRSVPQAMWWAVITITTIGYGDVTPITPIGKVVGGVVGFLGICIFALPVGILGSGFVDEMNRRSSQSSDTEDRFCSKCGRPLPSLQLNEVQSDIQGGGRVSDPAGGDPVDPRLCDGGD